MEAATIQGVAHELVLKIQDLMIQMDTWRPADGRGPMPGPSRAPYPYRLTARQFEVLFNIWKGLSNKQIATEMGLSHFTVARHVNAVMKKLNVDSRTQAAVKFENEELARHLTAKRPLAS